MRKVQGPPTRKGNRRPPPLEKRPKVFSVFRMLIAVAILGAAISFGTVAGVLASTFQVISNTHFGNHKGGKVKGTTDFFQFFSKIDRKVNILVMGSDYNYAYGRKLPETSGQSRSDTLMLVGVDPERKKINILSIPRDTRAFISGSHYDKINAALAYGGIDLARQTVTDLTGVSIDYYMSLKIDGLIKLVDLIGGVDIYVERDMYYVDESAHLGINIHKGWKHMNGEQAHQYVRFRKDELGDIGRVQRQQRFIRATMEQMLKPSSFIKIPELLVGAQENINTDMPVEMMGQIANFAKGVERDDVRMVMLPGYFSGSSFAVSYWIINYESARDVILDLFPESTLGQHTNTQAYYNQENEEPSHIPETNQVEPKVPQQHYKISVWNGTEDPKVSREAIKMLREAGWNVWAVKKAPGLRDMTQYIAQTGKVAILDEFRSVLGVSGEKIPASIGDISTDFTIVIGQDFANRQSETQLEQSQMERDARQKRRIERNSYTPHTPRETVPDYKETVDSL